MIAGKEYTGRTTKKNPEKKRENDRKKARVMGPRCNCKLSKMNGSKLKCSEFCDDDRALIFDHFWCKSWPEKKLYIECLVELKMPKDTRNRKKENMSRRRHSLVFHLQKNGSRQRVCKKMFLQTLAIGEWSVINWVESAKEKKLASPTEKTKPSKTDTKKRESVVEFLNQLPKVPSHYCRASTSRLYLEPIFTSKKDLFRVYKQYCIDKDIVATQETLFRNILTELNISIFKPRKDKCDLCIGHDFGTVPADIWDAHNRRKEEAREQKKFDKAHAEHVFTMDVQSVLLCPRTRASSMYYKTKLMIHNFTIYDLKTNAAYCFLWDETEADLSSNVFASMLHNFVTTKLEFDRDDEIIFYSDGCTYQNRNAIVANMFLHLAVTQKITIIQKILEKGHTQMEADSVHSAIESRIRTQEIYLPSGYVMAAKMARHSNPYYVEYLHHEFFRSFENLTYYKSIRPGSKKGDPVVTDLRALKYCPNGTIKYKLQYSDEWSELPQRRQSNKLPNFEDLPQLVPERMPVNYEKWHHLQELKAVLPKDTHSFYDELVCGLKNNRNKK